MLIRRCVGWSLFSLFSSTSCESIPIYAISLSTTSFESHLFSEEVKQPSTCAWRSPVVLAKAAAYLLLNSIFSSWCYKNAKRLRKLSGFICLLFRINELHYKLFSHFLALKMSGLHNLDEKGLPCKLWTCSELQNLVSLSRLVWKKNYVWGGWKTSVEFEAFGCGAHLWVLQVHHGFQPLGYLESVEIQAGWNHLGSLCRPWFLFHSVWGRTDRHFKALKKQRKEQHLSHKSYPIQYGGGDL